MATSVGNLVVSTLVIKKDILNGILRCQTFAAVNVVFLYLLNVFQADLAVKSPCSLGVQTGKSSVMVYISMSLIWFTTFIGRMPYNLAMFHVPLSMYSETFVFLDLYNWGANLARGPVPIQLSYQKEIFPLATFQTISFSHSFLDSSNLLHVWDCPGAHLLATRWALGQYFSSRNFLHRESLVLKFHQALAPWAWLTSWIDLNPTPPSLVGKHNFFHDTQFNFFFPSSSLQKKLAIILSIWAVVVLGIWITDDMWME